MYHDAINDPPPGKEEHVITYCPISSPCCCHIEAKRVATPPISPSAKVANNAACPVVLNTGVHIDDELAIRGPPSDRGTTGGAAGVVATVPIYEDIIDAT